MFASRRLVAAGERIGVQDGEQFDALYARRIGDDKLLRVLDPKSGSL